MRNSAVLAFRKLRKVFACRAKPSQTVHNTNHNTKRSLQGVFAEFAGFRKV